MKHLRILIIALLFPFALHAQSADQRIGELLGSGDWFSLNHEYYQVKDSVQSDVLRLMSETMLSAYFNRPEELKASLQDLINNHSEEIGLQNVCNMLALGAIAEGSNGNYALAADMLKSVIDKIIAAGAPVGETGLESTFDYYNAVRDLPAPSITMRGKSVKVPFTIKDIPASPSASAEIARKMTGKNNVIWIPVTINGKKYEFILDTGASYTALSESFAKEIGAECVRDTIDLHGANYAGGTQTQRALIRKMSIGAAEIDNLLAYVLSDNQLDTLVRTDAILGMDFIKLAGSLSIDLKRHKITFGRPAGDDGALPNLYLETNNTLCLAANVDLEPQVLKFDTGSTLTDLSYSWYSTHKDVLDGLEEANVLLGTYGSTHSVSHLSMSDVTFNVAGKDAIVPNVLVYTSPDGNPTSGTVGLALLRQFRKVILDLKNMTLTVR